MSDKNNGKVVRGSSCVFCDKREERETRKAKPNDAFIKSEMLAEEHIDHIQGAIRELTSGNIEKCLGILADIEARMHVTLAFGELFDIENSGNKVH